MNRSARWGLLSVLLPLASVGTVLGQERPDGTNRLAGESSPYLLLHARNPVNWYPWGEEAIELARELDRPIFLSIGYSTCYWCHRMEEDVFEDAEIAALMNEGFVNIKVDREERPDLDEIYMTATQLMTGRGGWPNSVFLTPELEPFFAGTYFPPEDRGDVPGFPTILKRIRLLWASDRGRIEESARRVVDGVAEVVTARAEPAAEVPGTGGVERAVTALEASYDDVWGGFDGPPKFPSPAALFLLLEEARRGDEDARRMLVGTLHRMGEGAIYDHLGGGFHRYATDREWRVPHFEKMLYDNAALAELLVDAARLTGDAELARLARGTLDFISTELTGPHGGFLSAIDAQTDGHEGAFYVWRREEVADVLDAAELELVASVLGLDEPPNFEGTHHTLYLTAPLDEHAARRGVSTKHLLAELAPALETLYEARRERPFPLVDDKVLTDWNGMAIAAFAKGGNFFDETRYRDAARKAAEFVLRHLRPGDGPLHHTYRGGKAKVEAFVDDYAFLVYGLLALHEETGERRWLDESVELIEEMETRLRDPRGGYYQSEPKPYLLFQTKSAYDGATRSANGIAVAVLLDLAERTGEARFLDRARAALRAFASDLERYPGATRTLAVSLRRLGARGALATTGGAPTLDELARSVVSASLELGPAGGPWRPFRLVLEIRDGWHVNANPASSRHLVATELRGELRRLVYPEGVPMRFAFSDEAISVYGGTVLVTGEIAGEATAVTLLYQPCDDTRCLAPVEKRVRVP